MEQKTITCSRCGKTVEGMEDNQGTVGFYRLPGTCWGKYSQGGEIFLCDECMWADPGYIRDYGGDLYLERKDRTPHENHR